MNIYSGVIAKVTECEELAFVEVAVCGTLLTATFIGSKDDRLKVGTPASVMFKEIEVALGKGLSGKLSLRNRLKGYVNSIENGRVIARIEVVSAIGLIRAIITQAACADLEIAVGDEVECLIKSNEVIVESADKIGEVSRSLVYEASQGEL